jgi:hypothetical protein
VPSGAPEIGLANGAPLILAQAAESPGLTLRQLNSEVTVPHGKLASRMLGALDKRLASVRA